MFKHRYMQAFMSNDILATVSNNEEIINKTVFSPYPIIKNNTVGK